MKIIKKDNLRDIAIYFKTLLHHSYNSENSNMLFHNTSKFFFKKKCNIVEDYIDLRGFAILPAIIMVLDKLLSPIISKLCKNKIISSQHGGR